MKQNRTLPNSHGFPAPSRLQARLATLVEEEGEYKAAQLIGCAHATISRVLAGMRVHACTIEKIEAGLRGLDR